MNPGAADVPITLVAAMTEDRVIGRDNALPWHLPSDLKHFKRVTMGHPVIMGRKTWESLKGALPGRENIVVTRQAGYQARGAAVASSLEAALALCAGESLACVIGGEDIFREALPLASGLVMTEIKQDFPGDARFPDYDRSKWKETQREPHTAAGGMRFDFVLYERA